MNILKDIRVRVNGELLGRMAEELLRRLEQADRPDLYEIAAAQLRNAGFKVGPDSRSIRAASRRSGSDTQSLLGSESSLDQESARSTDRSSIASSQK